MPSANDPRRLGRRRKGPLLKLEQRDLQRSPEASGVRVKRNG